MSSPAVIQARGSKSSNSPAPLPSTLANWTAGDGASWVSHDVMPCDFPPPGWPPTQTPETFRRSANRSVPCSSRPSHTRCGQAGSAGGASARVSSSSSGSRRRPRTTRRPGFGWATDTRWHCQRVGDVLGGLLQLGAAGAGNGPDPGRDAVRVRQDDRPRMTDHALPVPVRTGQREVTRQVMPAQRGPQSAGQVTQPPAGAVGRLRKVAQLGA